MYMLLAYAVYTAVSGGGGVWWMNKNYIDTAIYTNNIFSFFANVFGFLELNRFI
jgi:hypothetical protein